MLQYNFREMQIDYGRWYNYRDDMTLFTFCLFKIMMMLISMKTLVPPHVAIVARGHPTYEALVSENKPCVMLFFIEREF